MRGHDDGKDVLLREIEAGMRMCREKLADAETQTQSMSKDMGARVMTLIQQLLKRAALLDGQLKEAKRLDPIAFKTRKERLSSAWNSYRTAVTNIHRNCRAEPVPE